MVLRVEDSLDGIMVSDPYSPVPVRSTSECNAGEYETKILPVEDSSSVDCSDFDFSVEVKFDPEEGDSVEWISVVLLLVNPFDEILVSDPEYSDPETSVIVWSGSGGVSCSDSVVRGVVCSDSGNDVRETFEVVFVEDSVNGKSDLKEPVLVSKSIVGDDTGNDGGADTFSDIDPAV
ncbi:unnamed protein product [Gongylonema pulchrum]|uniref:HYR domain-containing protein n=1 Tax=Gongylonema pulchrum TaxID=637853 RepID=A0A183DM69_9BILA|nr:unnamed protein product [Gongylonema pulchrum]